MTDFIPNEQHAGDASRSFRLAVPEMVTPEYNQSLFDTDWSKSPGSLVEHPIEMKGFLSSSTPPRELPEWARHTTSGFTMDTENWGDKNYNLHYRWQKDDGSILPLEMKFYRDEKIVDDGADYEYWITGSSTPEILAGSVEKRLVKIGDMGEVKSENRELIFTKDFEIGTPDANHVEISCRLEENNPESFSIALKSQAGPLTDYYLELVPIEQDRNSIKVKLDYTRGFNDDEKIIMIGILVNMLPAIYDKKVELFES